MAYKYQFGAAVMSGSLTQEGTVIVDDTIRPSARDGAGLGTAAYQFGDLYLADGGTVVFGDDQDVTLSHYHDHGLTLTTSGDNGGGPFPIFRLFNSSGSPADDDDIGALEFMGKNDADQQVTAVVRATMTDVSDGAEDIGWEFIPMVNGSNASMFDISATTPGTVTISDGAYDLNVASHDGSNGLKLAGTLVTSTAAELNLLDATAGSSVALADGDGIIMFDASDSNTGKKVLMSDIETYVGQTNVQNIDNSGTLQNGFNYFSDLGGAESCTLPASPTVGNIVRVKAASNCSTTNTITINKAGSQTIDGQTSIVLESPYAAVNLCYVANNTWSIF